MRKAHCLRHNRVCFAPTADLHIAGTPCPAFSTIGKGLKTADPTIVPTCAWICMRLNIEEKVWIQENVPGFPPTIVGATSGFTVLDFLCVDPEY